MAGYIIGAAILTFAAWRLQSTRTRAWMTEFSGVVIQEISRKSSQTGRNRRLYAPRVSYLHPATGHGEIYEPTRFGSHRFTVGESTPLIYDPRRTRLFRPLERPARDTVVLLSLGIGFIVAQYFDR